MIGPISLDMKRMGARSAGNPHAACDVEGAGNVAQSNSSAKPARQSSTLPERARGCDAPRHSPTCAPMTAWPRRRGRSGATWPSITARDLTRVWAAARRTKPISVDRHWRRPHDVRRCCGASLWSGYALPTRRPTAAIDGDRWQGNHLSEPKRCSDKPGHLIRRCLHARVRLLSDSSSAVQPTLRSATWSARYKGNCDSPCEAASCAAC
jgi:hypothetical protein